MTRFKTLAVTALALSASSLALSNDANWVGVGGAGSFQSHKDIQMVKEHVRIGIDNNQMHVKVTFWFKNFGKDQMVTMAFPEVAHNNFQYTAQQEGKPAIREFRSWVDSQQVEVKWRSLPMQPEEDSFVRGVWTKRIAFKKGQSRKVDVDYKVTHARHSEDLPVSNYYILKSGATWRDKIKSCRIDVDWSKATKLSMPSLDLHGSYEWSRPSPKTATLRIKDLEPDFDIFLNMVPGFWNITLNRDRIPQLGGLHEFEHDSMLRGKPEDIQLELRGIPAFFSDGSGSQEGFWKIRHAASFGRSLEFLDERTFETGRGKRLKLRRPIQGFLPDDPEGRPGYVYLKDLIEALGGTYKYNAKLDQINLTLPKK